MLELRKFVFGPFSENTYLVFHTISREALIIDPGNADPYENKILHSFIDDNQLKLKYIIVTHSHIDHVLGVKCLKEKYSSSLFLAPEEDMPLLQNLEQQASLFGIVADLPPDPDEYINEGKEIQLAESTGEFIFTPGHTPGEHCLLFPSERMLFSGDVLFRDSIGRTDLWGGDYKMLINSINNQLLILQDNITVYPGHGGETTIGYEKKHNPFLKTPL